MTSEPAPAFSLGATGDAIITRPVLPLEGRNDRFDQVLRTLRSTDAAVTNLEVVLAERRSYATLPRAVPSMFQYLSAFPAMVMQSPPSILDDLSGMGIELFSTANNHAFDFGRPGMERTMRALDERGLTYAGMGPDLPAARAPGYRSTSGGRVGLVHATTSIPPGAEAGPSSAALPGRPGLNPLHVEWTYNVTEAHLEALQEVAAAVGIEDVKDTWLSREQPRVGPEPDGYPFMHMRFRAVDPGDVGIELSLYEPDRKAVLNQVEEAAAQADWVVATAHVHQGPNGTRNGQETPPFLEHFARECIDAGADAFVGTGPHVLRGIEIYDGKPIFYSLGNFLCQIETQDQLPAEAFAYYGIGTDDQPASLMDARYLDDGKPRGNLAYPAYWRSIVPTCRFDEDGALQQIDLLPISIGRTRPRAQRGTPFAANSATADRIFEDLASLSSPYGTEIDRDGLLGRILPG